MVKKTGVLLCILLYYTQIVAQNKVISGYVEDLRNGEKLIGANIYIPSIEKGTITNNYGFYSITIPESQAVTIEYSYVGYKSASKVASFGKDIKLNIGLDPEIGLDVVEIIAEKTKKIERETQMSVAEISMTQLEKIPALLGEVDVLRVLQLLPGVQSGGEGQSGFYVRGGSPDQNLILLDGVPVYNASHLFGFFSVFNSDAIKDVKLIKGGFPARYGGRLSSVLEINMKEGNANKFHGNASVGLVASKFTLEGPISKGKTSFILSGRRTYIDVLAKPFIKQSFSENDSDGSTGFYFYDLNAKINHKFSERDRLFLSMYTGKDKFYYDEKDKSGDVKNFTDTGFGWGNLTAAMRWNREMNNKLFANTTLTYSQYKLNTKIRSGSEYTTTSDVDEIALEYFSGIKDLAMKVDFDYLPDPDHFLRFGVNSIHHTFEPGLFLLNQQNSFNNINVAERIGQKNITALEYAAYVEDDFSISKNTKINAGIHLSGFAVDKKFYASIQPRFSINHVLGNNIGLKASFANMRQFINLLSFEGIGLPTDLWLPTTSRIKPQDSWQAAIGAAKTFKSFEVSVEGYYKKMKNLIAYKDGEGVFDVGDWQDRVTQGDGQSYGMELFIQKKKGRFSGWLGYTLSWTNRQFKEINNGITFPYRYDRRHDISLVGMYDISKKVNIAATWVYGTGNGVTLANSNYVLNNGGEFDTYGARNSYRMKPYHRLDIGINFVKTKAKYKRTWSIGAYNTYANKNPFYIYYSSEYDNNTSQPKVVLKQVSLFPLIPYINYSIDF